jgi:hypothetical protein
VTPATPSRGVAVDVVAGGLVVGTLFAVDVTNGLLAVCGLVLSRVFGDRLAAFAFAQTVVAVLANRFPSLGLLAAAEIGTLLLLFGSPAGGEVSLRSVSSTTFGLVVLGGLSILGIQVGGEPWIGAILTIAATALGAYTLYRYELVVTGVIPHERDS